MKRPTADILVQARRVRPAHASPRMTETVTAATFVVASLLTNASAASGPECLPPEVTGYAADHVRVLVDGEYRVTPAAELAAPVCVVAIDAELGLRDVRLADDSRIRVPVRDLELASDRDVAKIPPRPPGASTTHDRSGENQAGVKAIGDELERESP